MAATILKLLVAATTFGTNDVGYWMDFASTATTQGGMAVYREIDIFNHPPSMLHFLGLVSWIDRSLGLGFGCVLRSMSALADLGSVFILLRLAGPRLTPSAAIGLLLVVVSPVSLMVSGFHGNTDPIMILFVLLSVLLADRSGPRALSGAAFGLSICVKVVPVPFLPFMLLSIRGWRDRLLFVLGMAFTVGVLWFPYVYEDPRLVLEHVFGYASRSGHWGMTRLTAFESISWLRRVYPEYGRQALAATVLLLTGLLVTRRRQVSVFVGISVLVHAFLVFTPGFGVQYLVWLVPFALALPNGMNAAYQIAAGLFLFSVYTYWSGGFPWRYSDSTTVGWWVGSAVRLELAAWAVVVVNFAWLLFRVCRRPVFPPNDDAGAWTA